MRTLSSLALLAAALPLSPAVSPAAPPAPTHWVGTWATAPVAAENKTAAFAQPTTLREVVHVSLGGSTLRVVFSNQFGTEPLTLAGVTLALSTGNAASGIQPATRTPLAFAGHPGVTIPPGAVMLSDAVAFPLPPGGDLAITLALPAQTLHTLTLHGAPQHNGSAYSSQFDAPGDQRTAATLATPHTGQAWHFLRAVEVQSAAAASAIVAFGDSITDGAHSTVDANARWPDVLAARLAASGHPLGVLNEGIGGNRLLHDNTGLNALARFDQDVLAQSGVRYVVLMEGINDIGHAADLRNPYDVVTVDDLTAGLTQLARRAHAHGLKVFGATLTPYVGANYASPAGETMRAALNAWIRSSPEFDAVIDFDAATRDPARPTVLLPADDSGDHLHPGDAGYKAMGQAIDLKLFQ